MKKDFIISNKVDMAEHTKALGLIEKSNDEVVNLMREMIVRMADDTSETHRLLRHQQEDRQR